MDAINWAIVRRLAALIVVPIAVALLLWMTGAL